MAMRVTTEDPKVHAPRSWTRTGAWSAPRRIVWRRMKAYHAGKQKDVVSTVGRNITWRTPGKNLTQEAVTSQVSRNKSWRAWSRVVKTEMEMEIANPMAEERIMTALGTLLEKAARDSGVLFPSTSS
jgi:hypothetical protein